MRAVAIGLLLAACGSTPEAAPPLAQRTPVEQPKPVEQRKLLVDRKLTVGSHAPTARRMLWELTLGGSSASLLVTEQEAPGPLTIERADREAKWKTTGTRTEKGPLRHVGDHLALDLATDEDSLFLRCWHLPLKVATAGARRVPTPGHKGDCSDPGVWSPATLTRVDALVCGQGEGLDDGQLSGLDGQQTGNIDETLWRFAPAPGIEYVEESDDCFESVGLRLAK